MSVLQKIRATYLASQKGAKSEAEIRTRVRRGGRQAGSGWPSGSATGKCAAQLQMLRVPEYSEPEIFSVRAMMTFDEGHMIEGLWSHMIEEAFPRQSGLDQELFFFPVPLEPKDVDFLLKNLSREWKDPKRIWGRRVEGFKPPSITPTAGGRARIANFVERDPKDIDRFEREMALWTKVNEATDGKAAEFGITRPLRPKARPLGFVVDPAASLVWVPVYVDRVLAHPGHAALGGHPFITVLEKKSMSNFAFRRAMTGNMGYGERCQLVAIHRAINLPVTWLLYRKETAHLLEYYYDQGVPRPRVIITYANGQQEGFFTINEDMDHLIKSDGSVVDIPENSLWEAAEVFSPYDEALFAEIQERVRRVITWDADVVREVQEGEAVKLVADPAAFYREYGPDFTCTTCGGTGTQTLRKGSKTEPLKKSKPCEDCVAEDPNPAALGSKRPLGYLERVQLPAFPCGYCPVALKCWESAGVEREITDKPRLWITRAGFEASGLTFSKPKSAS